MKQFQRYVVAWFAMIAEFIFTIYKKLRSFHHAGNILLTVCCPVSGQYQYPDS